jgi:hypothetical protein
VTIAYDRFQDPDGTLITAHADGVGGLGLWAILSSMGHVVPAIYGNKLLLGYTDFDNILLGTGKVTDAAGPQAAVVETDGAQDVQFSILPPGGGAGVGATLQNGDPGDPFFAPTGGQLAARIDNQYYVFGDTSVAQRYGVALSANGWVSFFSEPAGGGARTYWEIKHPFWNGSETVWVSDGYSILSDGPVRGDAPHIGTLYWSTVTIEFTPTPGNIIYFSIEPATIAPPPPSSTITADPDTIEADAAQSTITVTALDGGGNPVVGATVILSATGTDNTITQPTAPMDANGQAVGYLSSTKAEVKTVSATVGGNDLGVTVGVTVTPGPPDPTFSYLDPSSLHTNVLAGGTGIGIWIRDQYGNGVAGETPGVAVGGGTVTDPVPTGGDGGTTTTYTPPTDSGPQTLTVTLGAVHLELPIEVDAGPLDHFGIAVPAEVMLGGQTVASCAAEDLYGNVVTGFTGQLDLTATGSRLLATPIRTAAFDAGVGFPALVFLDLATGVRVHGAEVRGAHSGVSNLFAVIEPWAPPAHPPGGSFTSGAGASGVWQPVPDREWEDRDG